MGSMAVSRMALWSSRHLLSPMIYYFSLNLTLKEWYTIRGTLACAEAHFLFWTGDARRDDLVLSFILQ
jgi:hypothetical protein